MNILKLASLLLITTLTSITYAGVTLDSFEESSIRIADPNGSTTETRLLWNQYEGDPTEGPDPGSEEISNTESIDGNQSLKINVSSGNIYAQFYSHINSTTWDWLRSFITEGSWEFNTYNRLRFWVKLPPGISKAGDGQSNTHFATYYRKSTGDTSSAESGGNHFYHYYDIESTGQWHQIIVDWHPNHIRGRNGGTDWGQREHPPEKVISTILI